MTHTEIKKLIRDAMVSYRRVAGDEDLFLSTSEACTFLGWSDESLRMFKSAELFLNGRRYLRSHLTQWELAKGRFGVAVSKGEIKGNVDGFRAWLDSFQREVGLAE